MRYVETVINLYGSTSSVLINRFQTSNIQILIGETLLFRNEVHSLDTSSSIHNWHGAAFNTIASIGSSIFDNGLHEGTQCDKYL